MYIFRKFVYYSNGTSQKIIKILSNNCDAKDERILNDLLGFLGQDEDE